MIKNYLKTSIRYLRTHKIFSVINLLGLSIGFCAAFFTVLHVRFELSYDRYNTNVDNIYRLVTDVHTPAGVDYQSTSAPMAKSIQQQFPEVKEVTRLYLDYFIVQKEKNSSDFSEEKIAYADASLFSVFTLPMISGNPSTALDAPFQVVLTQTSSKKYFGDKSPVGETIYLDGKLPAKVTGVMKDIPVNSHFNVDMLLSMPTLLKEFLPSMESKWERFGMYTYLLLQDNADINHLNSRLTALMNHHSESKQVRYNLSLEPLKSLYLKGKPRGSRTGSVVTGNLQSLYIFSLVALLILFIAGFNSVNLSAALSFQRAKETGVRKVIGATKKQLISQFLFDAALISGIACIVSVLLCVLLLPLFNELSGKVVTENLFSQWKYLLAFFAIAVTIGLLSGIYPALLLSDFHPASVLKGNSKQNAGGYFLRKALIVTQFSISVMLIIATVITYKQLRFMQTKEPGFNKEQQLVIDYHFAVPYQMAKEQLLTIPGVESVCISSAIPGKANRKMPISVEDNNGNFVESNTDMYFIDFNFFKQYHLSIVAGRAFSSQFSTDSSTALVVNEAMIKMLGYHQADQIIGKHFNQGWANGASGTVIGVVKDFHFHSFHEQIAPLAIRVHPAAYTFLTVNIAGNNLNQTVEQITAKWETIAPGLPMIYYFIDDAFDDQYLADRRNSKLILCFAAIAIIISCLGLFALSFLSAVQRTKEIGIRKILGANVLNITAMLSKDFLKLVCIAIALAIPAAWWMMHTWLSNYAYRTTISWWILLASALAAILIALLTMSFHSIKAAVANPVQSLRTE